MENILAILREKPLCFSIKALSDMIYDAQYHRVSGLVYRLLKKNSSLYPLEIIEGLKKNSSKESEKCLKQFKSLREIVLAFDKNEIRYLVLKGLLLSHRLYQDISVRQSKDIDIFIDINDLTKIDKVLRIAGYHPQKEIQFSKDKIEKLLKSSNDLIYCKGGIIVEVHYQLDRLNTEFNNFDLYWQQSRKCELFGYSFSILSEQDEWLFLCMHGSKHAWMRLQWLCDVAALKKQLPKDEVFWQEIRLKARQRGIEQHHKLAHQLINKYFESGRSVQKSSLILSLTEIIMRHHAGSAKKKFRRYSIVLCHDLLCWFLLPTVAKKFNLILYRPRTFYWPAWVETRLPSYLYWMCYLFYFGKILKMSLKTSRDFLWKHLKFD